jgi:hypothetical protein
LAEVSHGRFVRTLLAALALSAPFAFVAHAAERLVAPLTQTSVRTLLRLTSPLAATPPALSEASEPVESGVPDNWPEPVVLAGKAPAHGARLLRPSAPAPIFVSRAKVLALAQSSARPQGAFVQQTAEHPAGLRLSGVAPLGIGVQDGDILIEALGMTPRSPGQVIGAIIEARSQKARALSGTLWRRGQTFRITVEQPYLTAEELASAAGELPRQSP